ncbi:MAG TPA: hypothetical protein VN679_11415 [Candidatus Acidoferrales bacterium]|nr:hypothetical protein [Candidatus Acidoferrales bacterium]
MERTPVTVEDIERRHFIAYTEGLSAWHKHVTTLASGGLTLLISLQSNYIPKTPDSVLLIKICWVSLALCICAGLLVYFGQAQSRLDAANSLREIRGTQGEDVAVKLLKETNGVHFIERYIFRVARNMLPLSFLVSLVSLVWFAVINVGQ